MPKSQTIVEPSDPDEEKRMEEPEQSGDVPDHLEPIPNHPLAPYMGMFKDSAFFDDVVENMRIREEEKSKKYAEEELTGEPIPVGDWQNLPSQVRFVRDTLNPRRWISPI